MNRPRHFLGLVAALLVLSAWMAVASVFAADEEEDDGRLAQDVPFLQLAAKKVVSYDATGVKSVAEHVYEHNDDTITETVSVDGAKTSTTKYKVTDGRALLLFMREGEVETKTNTYDERGRLLESVTCKADGTLRRKRVREFDEQGLLLSETSTIGKDMVTSKYKYEDKRLVEIEKFRKQQCIERQEITYNESRGWTLKEGFAPTGGGGKMEVSWRHERSYDKQTGALLAESRKFRPPGAADLADMFKQEYAYDKNGDLRERTAVLLVSGVEQLMRFTLTRDSKRRVTLQQIYTDKLLTEETEYTYRD